MGENDDQRLWQVCGLPYSSCESLCISFFQKLERTWEEQVAATSTR